MDFFGYEFKRKKTEPVSFAPKVNDDGSVMVQEGGVYGTYVDMDGSIRSEAELVSKYREMSEYADIDYAIDDIVNEVITQDEDLDIVSLDLDKLEQPDKVKDLVNQEFQSSLKLLEFDTHAYEIFRRWYVDGRLYYHAILDKDNPTNGIVELRYIDPRKMRKIRENKKKKLPGSNVDIQQTGEEYFMYQEKGFTKSGTSSTSTSVGGLKIAKDSIIHCTSGLTSPSGDLVLSYLNKAIRPLNQLRSMEDSLIIYRISRAPERRVFYIDVGNLPKAKAEQYLRDTMTRFKNKVVYDQNTGEIKSDKKHLSMLEDFWLARREGCFTLDTKIPLLDGRELELGQLIVEHKLGKDNWVYSVDDKGHVVPGLISWAGVTRNNAKVIEVHLDNGEVVRCTPDHKFILRTGEKIEAQKLVEGSSLMPFNTRFGKIGGKDYTQVQHNDTEKFEYVHRVVSAYLNRPQEKNEVIHHVNMDRFNNNPDNLRIMDKKEHLMLHTTMASLSWSKNYEEHCKNNSLAQKAFYETERGIARKKEIAEFNKTCEAVWKGLENGRKTISENRKKDKETLSKEEFHAKWCKQLPQLTKAGAKAAADKMAWLKANDHETYVARCKSYGPNITIEELYSKYDLKLILDIMCDTIKNDIRASNTKLVSEIKNTYPDFSIKKLRRILSMNGYETISDALIRNLDGEYIVQKRQFSSKSSTNHKVLKIVEIDDLFDVGTLTIDENHIFHDHHNFALSSGIFVMNSRGTEISTLPGGMNLGSLDDIEYFQKKLYKSLNVPISRLDPDSQFNFGRATEISRDEVKFAKFISRLRMKFGSLFLKILERQLILKGIITADDWDEFKQGIRVKFNKDNFFSELKDNEILRDRISMVEAAVPYAGSLFSFEQIRKDILKQDEDKIKEVDKQIADEKNIPQYQKFLIDPMQQYQDQTPDPTENK